MTDDPYELSAWFLGPKAENDEFFERLIRIVLADYVHWRKNYFPSDRALVTRTVQRKLEERYEDFETQLTETMAELRRNFPFYSPRYLAHQLSDTTLPSLVGLFAGTLFNPNNVTPEAAPVTVDWEIEACSRVLEMLGFAPPPSPPKTAHDIAEYATQLRSEFGWAHITSGGTIANIEALWIARAVRYFPLAVRDVADREDIEVTVKLPSHTDDTEHTAASPMLDIRHLPRHQLLLLRPNESIFLLGKFVDAVRKKESLPAEEASARAAELLNASAFSATKGFYRAASEFPPKLFVSGAAHYSVFKAADVLGIGRDNVVLVRTDSMFRMDVADLERKLKSHVSKGAVPVAVIVMAGTTEEGAVDPLHEVVDLRRRLELENDTSFWIHVDGAWGGYCRTLLSLDSEDRMEAVVLKAADCLDIPFDDSVEQWTDLLADEVVRRAAPPGSDAASAEPDPRLGNLKKMLKEDAPARYIAALKTLLLDPAVATLFQHADGSDQRDRVGDEVASQVTLDGKLFDMDLEAYKAIVRRRVCDLITIEHRNYRKDLMVRYGEHDVLSALLAFPLAESITVDPHKMGYAPYPCGVIAFRNDRVRHFVLDRAPYITSARHDFLVHLPPRHLKGGCKPEDANSISTDAFAPFTLEGSRPGAAAVALHLSTSVIPLRLKGHGKIVRSSLLAAREVYEWLGHWDKIARSIEEDVDYEFVRYQVRPPDTNIVIFAVKKSTSRSIETLNRLTDLVYDRFTIQVELGEREYSYSQPFFLSRTTLTPPQYPYSSVKSFLDDHDIRNSKKEYGDRGLRVLRASVMNPYITPSRQVGTQCVIREFMLELAKAAEDAVVML